MASVYADAAWLYFLRAEGPQGPIKIGVTLNPTQRLRYHQIHSPVRLRFAALVRLDGAAKTERELHRRFSAQRLHGDWFAPSLELEAVIADFARLSLARAA